ncbi:uncharacterized protein CC84DRAFT_1205033 [Paraphaeosphaeria sporulosa]|uniref:Uncharacterized protein n=1 Tax=Paraphaeosphaeria sporulosa TaxID=1460663 RepID=A0A177CLD8_9PLEO|nr:uncharacterized protein CC84DRAFT_1205033 [Paraphaeosphaeria sporulosa]OAG07597.1 hypothetical protein CC84DRAFT_1205033 [Paraphaeosphaeria sporulosa]
MALGMLLEAFQGIVTAMGFLATRDTAEWFGPRASMRPTGRSPVGQFEQTRRQSIGGAGEPSANREDQDIPGLSAVKAEPCTSGTVVASPRCRDASHELAEGLGRGNEAGNDCHQISAEILCSRWRARRGEDCDGQDRRGDDAWDGVVVVDTAVSGREQHGGWNRYSAAHNCTPGP